MVEKNIQPHQGVYISFVELIDKTFNSPQYPFVSSPGVLSFTDNSLSYFQICSVVYRTL